MYRKSMRYKELDEQGRPTVRIEWFDDELHLIDADNLLVNADARGLSGLGVHGFDVRGLEHYRPAVRAGDLRPGRRVELHRQPDNPHDRNAVAVHALGASKPIGFVNKAMARTIARRMDGGDSLLTIIMRGTPAGKSASKVIVMVADAEMMAHLCRRRWPISGTDTVA